MDFTELYGVHSGENLATTVLSTLSDLDLQGKLISITGDNASNNEVMASELYLTLRDSNPEIQFCGIDSYIHCLAHILNLIVKDILHALKSGSIQEAYTACDSIQNGKSFATQTALARLQILALWISRSPQRRQKWKEVCSYMDLPDRFIEYDVETRWNSTYQMLHGSLKVKAQINRFLALQTEIPPFTNHDWHRLSQIHCVLMKFNELTIFISEGGLRSVLLSCFTMSFMIYFMKRQNSKDPLLQLTMTLLQQWKKACRSMRSITLLWMSVMHITLL